MATAGPAPSSPGPYPGSEQQQWTQQGQQGPPQPYSMVPYSPQGQQFPFPQQGQQFYPQQAGATTSTFPQQQGMQPQYVQQQQQQQQPQPQRQQLAQMQVAAPSTLPGAAGTKPPAPPGTIEEAQPEEPPGFFGRLFGREKWFGEPAGPPCQHHGPVFPPARGMHACVHACSHRTACACAGKKGPPPPVPTPNDLEANRPQGFQLLPSILQQHGNQDVDDSITVSYDNSFKV
jgi:hypothetical protein